MYDRNSEEVCRRLEGLGFTARPVEQAKEKKRPDILATRDQLQMYVEVKARELDEALQAAMHAVPIGAEEEQILTPLGKQNSLSAVVMDASKQLAAIAAAKEFRLLWFRVHHGLFVHGAV